MTRAQFQRLLDGYGGAPERWPPGQREPAERLLAADAQARIQLGQARSLGQVLKRSMTAEASEADVERLLGALGPLPPQQHGLFARWWPAALARFDFTPAWPRVAVLACVGALGFAVGMTNFGARLAADLAPALVASASEDVSLFDSDAITGLRP